MAKVVRAQFPFDRRPASIFEPHTGRDTRDRDRTSVLSQAAGVRGIGIAWGYHTVAQLSDAGASLVEHDISELRSCIRLKQTKV